jgi:hypothetical protein
MLLPPVDVLPDIVALARCGTVLALPCPAFRRRIAVHRAHRPIRLLARTRRAEAIRVRRDGKLPCGVAVAAGDLLELPGR